MNFVTWMTGYAKGWRDREKATRVCANYRREKGMDMRKLAYFFMGLSIFFTAICVWFLVTTNIAYGADCHEAAMAGWCDHQLQLRAEEAAQPSSAASDVPLQTPDELFWRTPEKTSKNTLNFGIADQPDYHLRAKTVDIISTLKRIEPLLFLTEAETWIWVAYTSDPKAYGHFNWYTNGKKELELSLQTFKLPFSDAMSVVLHELVHYQQDPTGEGAHEGCASLKNEIMALKYEAEAAQRLAVTERFRKEIDRHLFNNEMKYRIECEELD